MVTRIAIIEDDSMYREELRRFLHRFEQENGYSFRITEYEDGDAVVEQYTADYDILLMDIELPLLSGMDAAEEIRRRDADVVIIFITNSPNYAIQGYRVGALDYLVKPIPYSSFSDSMRRAMAQRDDSRDRYLVLNVRGGRQRIRIRGIRYVEVRDHDLTYHTVDGDIQVRGTFREAKEALSQSGFFHCNKGILVNLAYVDSIDGQDIHLGQDTLRLGNTKKRAFMDALNSYMLT